MKLLIKCILKVFLIGICVCYILQPKLRAQEANSDRWKGHYKRGLEFYENEQYPPAIRELENSLLSLRKAKDTLSEVYWMSAAYLGLSLKETKSFERAESMLLLSIQSINDSKDINYSILLEHLASLYEDIRNYEKAIQSYKKLAELAQSQYGTISEQYGKFISKMANVYMSFGYYQKALPLAETALDIVLKTVGNQHEQYGDKLNSLAMVYHELGNYKKSLELNLDALALRERIHGKTHPKYGTTLNNLGGIYNSMGDHKKALPLYEKALVIVEKNYGIEHSNYTATLNNIGGVYRALGKYEKSLYYLKKSREIVEQTMGKKHPAYGKALNNLALLHEVIGNYAVAIELYKESITIVEKTQGKNHPSYGNRLNNLGWLYFAMGDFKNSLDMYEKALINTELSLGKQHSAYGTTLNNLATLYSKLGDDSKAFPLYLESFKISLAKKGKDHPDYSIVLNNMAHFYEKAGEYREAIDLYLEAKTHAEEHLGWEHPYFGTHLNDLALLLSKLGAYQEANILFLSALTNAEKVYGEDHPEYITTLNNLSAMYWNKGDLENAQLYYQEALEKTGKVLGKKHYHYGNRLENLAMVEQELKNYSKALAHYQEAFKITIDQINQVFSFSTDQSKSQFIHRVYSMLMVQKSFDFLVKDELPGLSELNLNGTLLFNGLLLSSYVNILADLEKLNNRETDEIIQQYRSSKTHYNKEIQKSISQRAFDIDSLQKAVEAIESQMVKFHTERFPSKVLMVKDWKQIQKRLKQNEKAVVFSHFDLNLGPRWSDATIYNAYVISANSTTPEEVKLFEKRWVKSALSQNEHNGNQTRGGRSRSTFTKQTMDSLYKFIWKPLEPHLSDTRHIYFSPDGLLHQIPLLSLPDSKGKLMIDKYKMSQMANVATLVDAKPEPTSKDILLIGGIDYDYKKDAKPDQNNVFSHLETPALNRSKSNHNKSSKWPYLAGTKQEVRAIGQLFKEHDRPYRTLEGKLATEESFKALSGNSPSVLHIATHGFFFENQEKKPKSELDQQQYNFSDDPLIRSGLVFTGGNYAWQNGNNPFEEENGILTALEISNLDLSNTELVVLSACDTGLGDIDGSEGVFGLQRAFRMAGVENIIMSLWEVPDKETAEFMEVFYSRWLGGNSLRKAFNETQRVMAKKYKNEPQKWAGFVLVG